jgi:hypothetical protein
MYVMQLFMNRYHITTDVTLSICYFAILSTSEYMPLT